MRLKYMFSLCFFWFPLLRIHIPMERALHSIPNGRVITCVVYVQFGKIHLKIYKFLLVISLLDWLFSHYHSFDDSNDWKIESNYFSYSTRLAERENMSFCLLFASNFHLTVCYHVHASVKIWFILMDCQHPPKK